MRKLPSGLEKAVGSPQAGTPSGGLFWEVGWPAPSKPCHARAPPLFQPVPSVHANSTLPCASPTATGCLLLVGGETGSDTFPVFGSTCTKNTLPCVSAAARTPALDSDKNALLIGQVAIFQPCA